MWCKEAAKFCVWFHMQAVKLLYSINFDGCFVLPWNGVCANIIGFAKAVMDGRVPVY